MIFDAEALEDQVVLRLQDAVTAGEITWAGIIGDEAETQGIKVLPGLAVLFRRAMFQPPNGVDITRQMGMVEWSVFAAGSNLRARGLRAGRRGATGAYHATMVALKYLVGFEIAEGLPMWVSSIDLASYDPRTSKAMYEIGFQHEWPLVQYPYDEE